MNVVKVSQIADVVAECSRQAINGLVRIQRKLKVQGGGQVSMPKALQFSFLVVPDDGINAIERSETENARKTVSITDDPAGEEVTTRGQEVTTKGAETTTRGQESTTKGAESTIRGPENSTVTTEDSGEIVTDESSQDTKDDTKQVTRMGRITTTAIIYEG